MTLEDYKQNGTIQSFTKSEAYLPLYDLNNKPSKLRIEYRVSINFHTNEINGSIEFTHSDKKQVEIMALEFITKTFIC